MASEKPATIEQEQEIEEPEEEESQEAELTELEATLYSMENLDRPSPEIWPEKYPDMAQFINSYTPSSAVKMPYSKEMSVEDQNYLHQLARLPTAGLISKVKELHDVAYQLGVEEAKEVTRGKYLNLFKSKKENS